MTLRYTLAMSVPTREERTEGLFRDAADTVEQEFEQMEREHPTTADEAR